MSTTVLNSLKKWSLLGIFAVASGFGCAANGDATYDDAFGEDGNYIELQGEDGKNDGSDVDQIYSKYKATANVAYKYFNLRANGTFDFVLNSSENRNLGTTMTGTWKASDDLLHEDGADHYFMVALTFRGVKNATTSSAYGHLIGQTRDFEFTIPNDWGQEDWIKVQRIQFSGRTDARGKQIVSERGPLIQLNRCSDCALSDYDDEAIHDDQNFKVIVTGLQVQTYQAGNPGDPYPTRWDDHNDATGQPDLKVCVGAFCTNTLDDRLSVSAGSFEQIGTIKGEFLRAGLNYQVQDDEGFLQSATVIGAKRHQTTLTELDGRSEINLGSFGRVISLKLRLEQH